MPLFQSSEPNVYLIDTSAWLDIDLRDDSANVWNLIVTLIGQGRIIACAQVLGELRDNPMYLLRLYPYEAALQAGDRSPDDIDYLLHVGKITHAHPGMCAARGRKTKADAYVVALADLDKYIVVANETCVHRPNRKIPGVCKKLGILCWTLDEFVTVEYEAERKAREAEADNQLEARPTYPPSV